MFETRRFRELPRESLEEIYLNKKLKPAIEAGGIDLKRMAVFLDPNGELELRIIDYHHRSVEQGERRNVVSKPTKQGAVNFYCRFDVKGVGFIKPETHVSKKDEIKEGTLAGYPEVYIIPGSQETSWGYDTLGLFDERLALLSVKYSQRLAALGMRTEEYAALYRLNHVYMGGEPVTLNELRDRTKKDFLEKARVLAAELKTLKRKLVLSEDDEKRLAELQEGIEKYKSWASDVNQKFNPVIGVRLMRTAFRVRDLEDATPEQARFILEDAVAALNAERTVLKDSEQGFSLENKEERSRYLVKMAEYYGKNLGILMGNRRAHHFLHMGNLSLAGEFIDLDSICPVIHTRLGKWYWSGAAAPFKKNNDEYELSNSLLKDMRDLAVSIKKLEKAMKKSGYEAGAGAIKDLITAAYKGFIDGLGEKQPYQIMNVSNEKLSLVFKNILERVLVERRKFEPIKYDLS